ncbi:MAG: PIN domain-containing protein [Desulfamplus sp.]|nr:PIN domain-containing protein [Desulfamplus sp.]
MKDKIFVDTNLLVYSVANDFNKKKIANDLLIANEIIVSTQVINEFVAVTLRKKILQPEQIIEFSKGFMKVFEINVITQATISLAFEIMLKYHFSYWDSLIISSALESNTALLYSEDLQDRQIIENRLTICNPFKDV